MNGREKRAGREAGGKKEGEKREKEGKDLSFGTGQCSTEEIKHAKEGKGWIEFQLCFLPLCGFASIAFSW